MPLTVPCLIISLALIFFESVLTLPQEITLFWMRPFTGATVLFLLNKYIPVLRYILDLVAFNTRFTDQVHRLSAAYVLILIILPRSL